MIKKTDVIFLVAPLLFFCCDVSGEKRAEAKIQSKNKSAVAGQAVFLEKNGKVKIEISLTGAGSGPTAVHLHSVGDCSAEDATTSGGHWNPTQENHGKWGEPPFHSGDIGNIKIDESGNGRLTLIDEYNRWSIGGPPKTNLIGRAVVVHQGKDNMTSQPSGAAGKRTGCGPIIAVTPPVKK